MLPEEKIKSVDYLFNRIISERVRDSMEPKYSLLLGAGCSVNSGIESATGVIDMLKSIAYLRELPAEDSENPFLDLEYGNLIPFLKKWYNNNKENTDFLKFVQCEEEQIFKVSEDDTDFDGYFEEVFNGILLREHSNYINIQSSDRHKILIDLLNQNKEKIISDMRYSYWFTKYSTASEDIHSFLTELMNNKNPSEAYIFLADLFVNHMFSVAFTTNFDNLLGEALSLLGVRSKEIWFDTNAVDNTLSKTSPNIIKLHGDYMYNNTKNLSSETRKLSQPLQYQMENVLNKGGLIVIGYSGADNSIMYTLEKLSEKYSFPLFWCELEEKICKDQIHWRAKNLVLNASNAYFIPIKGFDSLVEKLRKNYIFYAKLRRNRKEENGIEYKETIYDESYLEVALQRIKGIIDKVIQQNKQISDKAIPVPPPDVDLLVK